MPGITQVESNLIQDQFSFVDALSENGETLIIKGWGSTNLLDRQREFVEPTSFDLATFLNSPTLLKNHGFIKDRLGNSKAAGIVRSAVPAFIDSENPENRNEWIVKTLASQEFLSTWPKSKSPNLSLGDRGVFVVAEVTHPEVIKDIREGELGAFSWKGFTHEQRCAGGQCELLGVDVVEFSVVNIPGQSQSTFMVTSLDDPSLDMEVSLKDCNLYQIQFDKYKYRLDDIKEYTKAFNIDTYNITENTESYFVQVGDKGLVEESQSFAVKVGDRNAIFAPKIEKKIPKVPLVGKINTTLIEETVMENTVDTTGLGVKEKQVEPSKLYVIDIESFQKLNPKAVIERQKSTLVEDCPVEIHTIELPIEELIEQTPAEAVVETPASPEVPVEPVVEAAVEPVAEAAVETPVETPAEPVQGSDQLDKILEALTQLTSISVQQTVKQSELESKLAETKSEDQIKSEVVSEVSQVVSKQLEVHSQMLAAKAKKADEQKQILDRQMASLGQFIPSQTTREETLVSSKSVDTPSEEKIGMEHFCAILGRVKEGK